jgi:hypothetical protein
MTDSGLFPDNIFPVTETLNGGELTVTATGLDTKILPVNIDPSFDPVNPTKDANILEEVPTTGFGQNTESSFRNKSANARRNVTQFDASAIPSNATIVSVTAEWKNIRIDFGSPVGLTMYMQRLTDYDWEDDGIATLNAECNWDNRKDPAVAWSGGGGGGVDAAWTSTTTAPAAGSWMQFTDADAISIMQDAVTNRGGLFNVRVKYATETETSPASSVFATADLENATAADRPKLSATYTVPPIINTHLGYKQMVF